MDLCSKIPGDTDLVQALIILSPIFRDSKMMVKIQADLVTSGMHLQAFLDTCGILFKVKHSSPLPSTFLLLLLLSLPLHAKLGGGSYTWQERGREEWRHEKLV